MLVKCHVLVWKSSLFSLHIFFVSVVHFIPHVSGMDFIIYKNLTHGWGNKITKLWTRM